MSIEKAQMMTSDTQIKIELTTEQIMRLIPHRAPMLMVEKLVDVVTGESAVGIKTISPDEWFFKGHFPKKPVMPGVMIIEALAQTAAALAMHSIDLYDKEKLVYFMGIDDARFRKMVFPNDILHLEVTKIQRRGPVWKFKGVAKVNGEVVAEAVKTAMISDE